ncbi:MmgE/PrpD family protein [Kribbella sancticallisti]|uniref:MmgE/PrpD family protein n=1 Tax=Kribbella sancticallisti TaxID=460087 RepID=A0ABP4QLQ0_9ACTN
MTAELSSRVGKDVWWRDFADRIRTAFNAPLPAPVRHEALRSLVNVLGVGLGASRSEEVGRLVRLALTRPPGSVPVIGRTEQVDAYQAALIAGFAAHLDDFDDTHLATVIHPGASCLGAVWGMAGQAGGQDHDILRAFAIGCEAQLRLGMAVTPGHYQRGWHITGTCGVVGAAVTSALLMDASVEQVAVSIRLAAAQTLGHREAFGTELKPLHAGKAAANGLVAASTAKRWLDEDGGLSAEGERSMLPLLRTLSADNDPDRLLTGFGEHWELLSNTYKPYPCGIVAHPGIDAAIEASGQHEVRPDEIERIDYECHPLVLDLMGNLDPETGLQARFSAVHGVAVGLLAGTAGLAQFEDESARSDEVRSLRQRIVLVPRSDLNRDQANLRIVLRSGREVVSAVRAARGSLSRPLSDEELVAKVDQLVAPLGSVSGIDLWNLVDSLERGSRWRDLVVSVAGQTQGSEA